MTNRLYTSLLLPLFILGGCLSVPKPADNDHKATAIYSLHPHWTGGAETGVAAAGAIAIVVPKPGVPVGFETDRIALYLEEGRRLDYYAGAKWAARLDDLAQDFIVQTTRHGLPGKVVDTSDLGGAARFRMIVKITDFQPVYGSAPDTAPRLEVAMTVTLIALPGETIKTQFSLKKNAPAGDNTLTSIAKGLEELLQSLTEQAVQRVIPYLGEK